jgi:hypothetical protein
MGISLIQEAGSGRSRLPGFYVFAHAHSVALLPFRVEDGCGHRPTPGRATFQLALPAYRENAP